MNTQPVPTVGSRVILKNAKYFEEDAEVLEIGELRQGTWTTPGKKIEIQRLATTRKYRVKVIRTGEVMTVPESHLIESQKSSHQER